MSPAAALLPPLESFNVYEKLWLQASVRYSVELQCGRIKALLILQSFINDTLSIPLSSAPTQFDYTSYDSSGLIIATLYQLISKMPLLLYKRSRLDMQTITLANSECLVIAIGNKILFQSNCSHPKTRIQTQVFIQLIEL